MKKNSLSDMKSTSPERTSRVVRRFVLVEELEKGNTRANRDRVAERVGTDKKRFRALMEMYLKGELRQAQLAAGVLSVCADNHPQMVQPWLPQIIKRMDQKGVHDAVQRTGVRILQFVDIPERLSGRIANICFGYLEDISQPIAVRVFAMTVLANIAKKEPDLVHELVILIRELLPYGTGAFLSRARHTLKQLGIRSDLSLDVHALDEQMTYRKADCPIGVDC